MAKADLLIGAVLIPGGRTPLLCTEEMVKSMQPGAVIIDVAIDQGGCIETMDRTTCHREPTYERYGVLHYAVPNMPGAVPQTSTYALSNATLPFALELAEKGWERIIAERSPLSQGINIIDGRRQPGGSQAHSLATIPLPHRKGMIATACTLRRLIVKKPENLQGPGFCCPRSNTGIVFFGRAPVWENSAGGIIVLYAL